MKIAVGFDERTKVTDKVVDYLEKKRLEFEVSKVEAWPDVAREVARKVSSGKFDQGILLCWTGTGTSMAANKVKGIRAALVWNPWIAKGARRWNDANILVMSSKKTELEMVEKILNAWFKVKTFDSNESENITKLKDEDK